MFDLSGLNAPQQQAAKTIEGPVLILAGAGSGKTRTVTFRIGHMVKNIGISPEDILAVSFTNKAAQEMRERVKALLGTAGCRGMTLSTFHSLGVQILKQEIEHLGMQKSFSIYDQSDQISIVRQALKSFKSEKNFDRKMILSKIGFLKNRGISPDEYPESVYFDPDEPDDVAAEYVYHFYQEKLRFYNAIDFDDILYLCVKLFKQNPQVAEKYSRKFKYIMIDEYQDTNPLQFEMVLGLTSTHNNLCVVGDDDQSIYAFRGADVTNILNFEKQFPGAKVILLEQNYRSTTQILNLANTVIAENKNRKDKRLWSEITSENTPLLWAMGDTDHEAQVIVDEIGKYQTNGGFLGNIAILYRSNTQAPPVEDQLRMTEIPYKMLGGQKFYDKKEIKDLAAYLLVVLNSRDELSLRRILNVPNRGIGMASLKKFLAKSAEEKISLFEALRNYPELGSAPRKITQFVDTILEFRRVFKEESIATGIERLIEHIEYYTFVEKQYDSAKQITLKKNDIINFIESAARFERQSEDEKPSLKEFAERLLLMDSQDSQKENEDDTPQNEVTLMTLHSSKGLEFDIVYLLGMEEECLPHKKTISLGEDVDEERRLCYVGITRAKKKLFMTYCKQRKLHGRDTVRHPSRFVKNLPKGLYIEQDRTTFGHLSEDEAKEYKKSFFSNLIDSLD